jgi:hypothetical protein
VVVAAALLVAFSLAGGLGIIFDDTAAIVVGWAGFAVTVLVAYWAAPAGPTGRSPSRSAEGG